ncbi:hypothetical protein J6TS7_40510 [Paenibacillus dendritiformis]|nr:hypothetical protein J6TS7_40510 [Paenibacillus dendritiformis]
MKSKILVVDDEPSISTLIEYNLKLAGYEVMCVCTMEKRSSKYCLPSGPI